MRAYLRTPRTNNGRLWYWKTYSFFTSVLHCIGLLWKNFILYKRLVCTETSLQYSRHICWWFWSNKSTTEVLIACHSSDRSDQAASSEGTLGSALGAPRFLQIQATAWQLSVSHPHFFKRRRVHFILWLSRSNWRYINNNSKWKYVPITSWKKLLIFMPASGWTWQKHQSAQFFCFPESIWNCFLKVEDSQVDFSFKYKDQI